MFDDKFEIKLSKNKNIFVFDGGLITDCKWSKMAVRWVLGRFAPDLRVKMAKC